MTSETHEKIKANIENIAEALQDHIKIATGGKILPFNLIIFTDDHLFQTISNQPPETMIPALEDAIEIYKSTISPAPHDAVLH